MPTIVVNGDGHHTDRSECAIGIESEKNDLVGFVVSRQLSLIVNLALAFGDIFKNSAKPGLFTSMKRRLIKKPIWRPAMC
jgi:hypothetical protein